MFAVVDPSTISCSLSLSSAVGMGGEPKESRYRRRNVLPATYRGRQACILALFFLAVLFSLRAWRVATILPGQDRGGDPWSPSGAAKPGNVGDGSQCEWRSNGPLLYNLEHSNLHADGEDSEGGCSTYSGCSGCVTYRFYFCWRRN